MEEPVIDNELLLEDENMADGADEVSCVLFIASVSCFWFAWFVCTTSSIWWQVLGHSAGLQVMPSLGELFK